MSASEPTFDALPSVRYYRACVGAWRGEVELTLTDVTALAGSGMAMLDRLSVRLMAAWPKWLPRPVMSTSVRFRGPLEVVHTTTVSWLGVPLQQSEERFDLDTDGRTFEVRGDVIGRGDIDEHARCGRYELRWRGVDLVQRTVRDADTVTVRQEGPGFTGRQVLARRGRARSSAPTNGCSS